MSDLSLLRSKLKQGDYDGVDIMEAWLAIDELIKLQKENEELYKELKDATGQRDCL